MTQRVRVPEAQSAAGRRGFIMDAIREERKRQDDKWGADRDLHPFEWLAILKEEVGEAAEIALHGRQDSLDHYTELVQACSVTVAWAERERVNNNGESPEDAQHIILNHIFRRAESISMPLLRNDLYVEVHKREGKVAQMSLEERTESLYEAVIEIGAVVFWMANRTLQNLA